LRLYADGLATLRRTTLNLNGAPAWTTPPVAAALGVGWVAQF
jgi:hypothetical protein